jgi:hypothetical protein
VRLTDYRQVIIHVHRLTEKIGHPLIRASSTFGVNSFGKFGHSTASESTGSFGCGLKFSPEALVFSNYLLAQK